MTRKWKKMALHRTRPLKRL